MTTIRAQKDLILLYNDETFKQPTETIDWLNARRWISAHHHVFVLPYFYPPYNLMISRINILYLGNVVFATFRGLRHYEKMRCIEKLLCIPF